MILDGKPHGYGKKLTYDGQLYIGDFHQGNENGYGTLFSKKSNDFLPRVVESKKTTTRKILYHNFYKIGFSNLNLRTLPNFEILHPKNTERCPHKTWMRVFPKRGSKT